MNEGGPGYRRLKRHPNYEAMIQRTIEMQQAALKEAVQRPSAKGEEQRPDGYPVPKK